MTHMTVVGDLDVNYAQAALLEVLLLWRIPTNIEEILVIDDPRHFKVIEKYIPKEIRSEFRQAFTEDPTSMSLTYKKFDLVIISISKKEEAYLKKNKKALTGIFAHELMHIHQRRQGLDARIRRDAINTFKKFSPKLEKLKGYDSKQLGTLFGEVGRTANFVLKDIYANTELIDKGLGEYILEDYKGLYSTKKTCPVGLFSYNLKEKPVDLKALLPALNFELQLLPAIVPFMRMYKLHKTNRREIKKFVNYIADCYEINAAEIAKRYDKLMHFAADNIKDTPVFRQRFYKMLFEEIYHLIK